FQSFFSRKTALENNCKDTAFATDPAPPEASFFLRKLPPYFLSPAPAEPGCKGSYSSVSFASVSENIFYSFFSGTFRSFLAATQEL
ncbi:MAG: hypothetical protein LPK19_07745, partial [Hymenobacteraceae bacterium]|nr:hypothetical protein [Hymenobacteraceae bacterium]MDX5396101.1 hypothetical protein [Hymenobacteraceae bacterium]MDX5512166.1 hypothetical protein [Hymenobacteraceae bacterium]